MNTGYLTESAASALEAKVLAHIEAAVPSGAQPRTGTTCREIAAALDVLTSTLSGVLNRLYRKGLIERETGVYCLVTKHHVYGYRKAGSK